MPLSLRLTPVMLALVLSTSAVGQAPGDQCTKHDTFPQSCNPFDSQAKAHPIDNLCGLSGDADDKAGKAQDSAKNNLCVTGSTHVLTIARLKTLQKDVDKTGLKYGNPHAIPPLPGPPDERAPFFQTPEPAGFREGDLVSFVGYIVNASAGDQESVNCHCNGQEFNDVHVVLAASNLRLKAVPSEASASQKKQIEASNNAKLCKSSFTAEAIPHRRPDAWGKTGFEDLQNNKKIVKITGQLFFDASHLPCRNGKRGSADPARFTSWEIHPVYEVQVCKHNSLAACRAGTASDWMGL